MNFRYKIMQFMSGRYGFDALSGGIVAVSCTLSFINIFFRSVVVSCLSSALLVCMAFRFLSRNLPARRAENARFVDCLNALRRKSEFQKQKKADSYHVYRKCPTCRAILRLPRRVGKHTTVCPKCSREFRVKVRK